VEHEWNEVDSALATLGVPVFRVPGNHDLHDPVTREIWSRRYGQLPRAIVVHGHRFLMLRSAAIRPDSGADKFIRGRDLDSTQLEFIRRETANRIAGGRTFAFVHHLLWWQPPEGGWWRQVHPLLVAGGVEAVFSGDFGPVKFSTLSRDGIRYFQTSVMDSIPVVMQRNQESNRMLAGQFDNFLLVSVGEGAVDVEVRTVGWEASGDFSPLRWREVHAPRQEPPPPPRWRRMWELIGSPRRLGAIAVVAGLVFAAGAAFGRARSRRSP
jgi:hypothetical protein